MAKDNGFCGVGVAYQSSITGENCLIPVSTLAEISTHPIDPKYKLLYTPHTSTSREVNYVACIHQLIETLFLIKLNLISGFTLWEPFSLCGNTMWLEVTYLNWSLGPKKFPGLTPPRMELIMFRAFPVNWTSLNANVSNVCPLTHSQTDDWTLVPDCNVTSRHIWLCRSLVLGVWLPSSLICIILCMHWSRSAIDCGSNNWHPAS